MIYSDLGKRSYKFWDGELLEDGTVISSYGVVGAKNPQSRNYGVRGEAFLNSKIREKERKGYTEAKVILAGEQTTNVNTGSLADIAVSQIKFNGGPVETLIRKLANSNVHKITSSTNISFDDGVFQTPLGIVTQEGIDDARNHLAYFFKNIKKNGKDEFNEKIDSYLRIIPRAKGGGLQYEDIFPDLETVTKESDVLDALENSLEIATQQPVVKGGDATVENIFDLDMGIEEDSKVREKIEAWYKRSNKAMHHYGNIKIREIYSVNLVSYNGNYKESIGNPVNVWHGSGQSNILSILKSGLTPSPPSTAAIAGKLYGNGVYGSETASKSLGYSLGRWGQGSGDSGWLLVCEFAMGNIFYPTTYGINGTPKGYDSCWALPKNTGLYNDELIVYDQSQIRIKHLIELK